MTRILNVGLGIILVSSFSARGQNRSPHSVIEASARTHAVNDNFVIVGTGSYTSDSHLRNPNSLDSCGYSVEIKKDVQTNRVTIKHVFKFDKELVQVRDYVNHEEFIFDEKRQSLLRSNLRNKTNPENKTSFIKSYSLYPQLFLLYLLDNKGKIPLRLSTTADVYEIEIVLPNGDNWILHIAKQNFRCVDLKRSYFHYLYGDVTEEIRWTNYIPLGHGYFPSRVTIFDKGYQQFSMEQKMTVDPAITLQKIGMDSVAEEGEVKLNERMVSEDSIKIERVSDGLFEIKLSETNNRLMIAEFSDFLILLEGSYHSKNGDRVISAIHRHFRDKPIRYASFSHCHYQYIGFARSLAANRTSIITTEGNARFIEKLCTAPFTLRPDKQEKEKRKPVFEMLNSNSWKFVDATNSIEVYNIASTHTDDYLMFYFPRQKTVFIGDLLWVPSNGNPITGRSLVFYNEILRLKLDVDKYFISWPLKGYPVKSTVTSNEIILPQPLAK